MHLANLKKSGSRPADLPTLKATFSSPSSILPCWKNWTLNNKALSLRNGKGHYLAAASTACKSEKLKWWQPKPLQTSGGVLLKRRYRKDQAKDERQIRLKLLTGETQCSS